MAPDHLTGPTLALVGYGRIAPKHVEVFRALNCRFVAVCDRSQPGQDAARANGIEASYPTIGEMIESARPQGVICCPSVDQVFSVARQVIPSGIPTLLEKPPGTSVSELAALEELAEQHRTPVMVGLNRRGYSVVQRAIDDAGGLDQITSAFVDWSEDPRYLINTRKFTLDQVRQWIFGNSLHGLDLLTHLAGGIPKPAIHALNAGEPCRWTMALQGISDRGALAAFHSTWDSPARWRVVFCTPGRRYTFAPLETCKVLESGKGEREIEPDSWDQRFKPGFHAQATAFLRAIETGRLPEQQSLSSALPAMRLAERLTESCLDAGCSVAELNS